MTLANAPTTIVAINVPEKSPSPQYGYFKCLPANTCSRYLPDAPGKSSRVSTLVSSNVGSIGFPKLSEIGTPSSDTDRTYKDHRHQVPSNPLVVLSVQLTAHRVHPSAVEQLFRQDA